jgi:hypothetical protein
MHKCFDFLVVHLVFKTVTIQAEPRTWEIRLERHWVLGSDGKESGRLLCNAKIPYLNDAPAIEYIKIGDKAIPLREVSSVVRLKNCLDVSATQENLQPWYRNVRRIGSVKKKT